MDVISTLGCISEANPDVCIVPGSLQHTLVYAWPWLLFCSCSVANLLLCFDLSLCLIINESCYTETERALFLTCLSLSLALACMHILSAPKKPHVSSRLNAVSQLLTQWLQVSIVREAELCMWLLLSINSPSVIIFKLMQSDVRMLDGPAVAEDR